MKDSMRKIKWKINELKKEDRYMKTGKIRRYVWFYGINRTIRRGKDN